MVRACERDHFIPEFLGFLLLDVAGEEDVGLMIRDSIMYLALHVSIAE